MAFSSISLSLYSWSCRSLGVSSTGSLRVLVSIVVAVAEVSQTAYWKVTPPLADTHLYAVPANKAEAEASNAAAINIEKGLFMN